MGKLLVVLFISWSGFLVFADESADVENYKSLTYEELLAEEEAGTMDVQLAYSYCIPIASYGPNWSKTTIGYVCNNLNSRNYGLYIYGLDARIECDMSCTHL